jgi:hypothetical protein
LSSTINRSKKGDTDARLDPGLQDLYDHIRLQFVANAGAIAKNEKPERLLKMLQTCPELKPAAADNKELWRIVQRVRKEILAAESVAPAKTKPEKEK